MSFLLHALLRYQPLPELYGLLPLVRNASYIKISPTVHCICERATITKIYVQFPSPNNPTQCQIISQQ